MMCHHNDMRKMTCLLVAELPASKDNHLDFGRPRASVKTHKPESSALIILLIPSFYIMGNIHVFTDCCFFFLSTHNLGK